MSRRRSHGRLTQGDTGRDMEITALDGSVVDRGWATLQFEITQAAADLSRVEMGVVPYLNEHDRTQQIGAVISARVEGQQLKANVRWANNSQAAEVREMVQDGIRRGVSVGVVWDKEDADVSQYPGSEIYHFNIRNWQLLEISSVSVPAIASVGFSERGRYVANLSSIGGSVRLSASDDDLRDMLPPEDEIRYMDMDEDIQYRSRTSRRRSSERGTGSMRYRRESPLLLTSRGHRRGMEDELATYGEGLNVGRAIVFAVTGDESHARHEAAYQRERLEFVGEGDPTHSFGAGDIKVPMEAFSRRPQTELAVTSDDTPSGYRDVRFTEGSRALIEDSSMLGYFDILDNVEGIVQIPVEGSLAAPPSNQKVKTAAEATSPATGAYTEVLTTVEPLQAQATLEISLRNQIINPNVSVRAEVSLMRQFRDYIETQVLEGAGTADTHPTGLVSSGATDNQYTVAAFNGGSPDNGANDQLMLEALRTAEINMDDANVDPMGRILIMGHQLFGRMVDVQRFGNAGGDVSLLGSRSDMYHGIPIVRTGRFTGTHGGGRGILVQGRLITFVVWRDVVIRYIPGGRGFRASDEINALMFYNMAIVRPAAVELISNKGS